MCVVNVYRATNIYNGEVVEGSAKVVAEKIGVSDVSVRVACNDCTKIKKAWSVEIVGSNKSGKPNIYATPEELFNDWDITTAPFKALSKKVREKREKKKQEENKE